MTLQHKRSLDRVSDGRSRARLHRAWRLGCPSNFPIRLVPFASTPYPKCLHFFTLCAFPCHLLTLLRTPFHTFPFSCPYHFTLSCSLPLFGTRPHFLPFPPTYSHPLSVVATPSQPLPPPAGAAARNSDQPAARPPPTKLKQSRRSDILFCSKRVV